MNKQQRVRLHSNLRAIQRVLSFFHPSPQWPKTFEGGYQDQDEHDEVRKYLTEIIPKLYQIRFKDTLNGTLEVSVLQIINDSEDKQLFDGIIKQVLKC